MFLPIILSFSLLPKVWRLKTDESKLSISGPTKLRRLANIFATCIWAKTDFGIFEKLLSFLDQITTTNSSFSLF
ncbi:hypothetical protein MHBO_003180 [Bonamia ostreae]|uniref:Uncharacterized protein n=1 Tax=Bonamia ostreae TaxID=126728 RepID=A0ABV2APR4_9EUKA